MKKMTEAERQELRNKHKSDSSRYCSFCYQRLNYGKNPPLTVTPYPCDVIKVLDFYDKLDTDILEIIHTYDQEPITAVVRIWDLLGNRA